jgi:cobalt/nickel transport system permease protein
VVPDVSIFVLGERYHHGQGILHRADPRVKLLVAVLFAFAVTSVPEGHWRGYAGFALLAFVSISLSRVPPLLVLGRSLLALPFLAAAVPLIFTRSGETVFVVPVVGWTASAEGMVALGSILLKSWLAVLVAIVLTSCTQPVDLIRGLERLRVPRVLAATIFFMYRYLFVIGAEGQRLMRARDARSAVPDPTRKSGCSVIWRGRVLGSMIGSLFIRSFERSERIYAAMLARGYDGSIRFANERSMLRADWILLVAGCTTLTGLVLYARL